MKVSNMGGGANRFGSESVLCWNAPLCHCERSEAIQKSHGKAYISDPGSPRRDDEVGIRRHKPRDYSPKKNGAVKKSDGAT